MSAQKAQIPYYAWKKAEFLKRVNLLIAWLAEYRAVAIYKQNLLHNKQL
jgi:hypothetical protein